MSLLYRHVAFVAACAIGTLLGCQTQNRRGHVQLFAAKATNLPLSTSDPHLRFGGAFLEGPFGMVKGKEYQALNEIAPGEGYRFSIDQIHVRYTDEIGSAEVLVYIQLFRGTDLKPFYSQVIAHEIDLPDEAFLNRLTVMTPAFEYRPDEPVVCRLVMIEIDTEEEKALAGNVASLGKAIATIGTSSAFAEFAPSINSAIDALVSLVQDGDDIEMQRTVAFYPQGSPQIRMALTEKEKTSQRYVGKTKEDVTDPYEYLTELPFVAGQFVLIKDENELRRVSYDTAPEVALMSVVRIVPVAAWLVSSIILDPFLAFGHHDLSDWWQYPGLWEHPVSEESARPSYEIKNRLAIYNNELRSWSSTVGPRYVDTRPNPPYKEKSYIIFSLLRTDEGVVGPSPELVQEQIDYIQRAVADPSGVSNVATLERVKQATDTLTAAFQFHAITQRVNSETRKSELARIRYLLNEWEDEHTSDAVKSMIRDRILTLIRSDDSRGVLWGKLTAKGANLGAIIGWDGTTGRFVSPPPVATKVDSKPEDAAVEGIDAEKPSSGKVPQP